MKHYNRAHPGPSQEMFETPKWISQDFSPYELAAVNQGGCASGAYMPAVTYHQAIETMNAHGDKIFDYLEDALGKIPAAPEVVSWAGLACFYVSCAVELWCAAHEELEDWDDEEPLNGREV